MDVDADPGHYVRLMDLARGGREDDPAQYGGLFGALAARDGERVLDVGCGTGGTVRALAAGVPGVGRVVGLDVSGAMIAEARARTRDPAAPVEFVGGDAHAMPFPDGSFDGAYSTRVFEIVGGPRRVLAEMARVLRPGGRIVVNGPDIGAWVIDSPDRDVTRRIFQHVCDFETNGWVGRQLPGWCRELGLSDLRVTPVTNVLTEFETLYEVALRAFVENAAEAGAVNAAEAARWVEELRDRDRRGLFFFSQTYFRVTATQTVDSSR